MLSFARVRALGILTLLIVSALVAVYLAISRDTSQAATEDVGCPAGSVSAQLSLPDARDIKLNVYNGSNRSGLANQIGDHFANRDFDVRERGDDPLGSEVEGVVELRYGPRAVGAAHVLQAYFLNDAVKKFDIDREDDEVDVVIGALFRQLATETEVRQSIAALGNPVPPPGTCPSPAPED